MPPNADLQHQSDAQLLAWVAGDNRVRARAAEHELYQRHVRYLYGALHRQRDKLLSLAGLSAEDVVQDTFQRAFERAGTFREEPGMDAERARRRTRAWLGRIAQNLVADAFRRFREVSSTPYLEQVSVPAEEEEPPASRPELAPMRQAMAQLSEREQDILRVSALYYKAGDNQRLPNAVSAELAQRWSTSNENVRAIRSRAMKKLRQAMADSVSQRAEEQHQ